MPKEIPSSKLLYLAISTISGGAFLFQIILSAILGFLFFNDFRVVGVAFGYLGFGLGGIGAFWITGKKVSHIKRSFLIGSFFLIILGVMPFILIKNTTSFGGTLPLNTVQYTYLFLTLAVSVVYFIASGYIVSSLYTFNRKRPFHLYFFDLLGAGISCVMGLLVVDKFGIFSAIPAIFLVNSIGFISIYLYFQKRPNPKWTIFAAAGVAAGLFILSRVPFQLICNIPGRTFEVSRSNSFSLVQLEKPETGNTFTKFTIVYNCRSRTVGYITKNIEAVRKDIDGFQNIPFLIGSLKNVLILGSGAGMDVDGALLAGAGHVQAVEINPLIIELTNSFPKNLGHSSYQEKGVSLATGDARSFVNQTKSTYDLLLIAYNKGNFGKPLASPDIPHQIYTKEALSSYIKVLNPQGILTILDNQPLTRVLLKTLISASTSLGENPNDHIAVLSAGEPQGMEIIVYKKSLISPQNKEKLRNLASNYNARYQEAPATALIPEATKALTDDRPFFLRTNPVLLDLPIKYKTSNPDDIVNGPSAQFLSRLGYLFLLAVAILIICVTVFLHNKKRGTLFGFPLYCIGSSLGLAALEYTFLQKGNQLTSNPTQAHALILSSFLIGAALGSIGLAGFSRKHFVKLGLTLISLMGVTLFGFFRFTSQLILLPSFTRTLILIVTILPLSYLAGAFFPYILRSAGKQDRTMIPWIWGIDTIAFVASSLLLQYSFFKLGINTTLIFGPIGYSLAVIASKYLKS